MNTNKATLNFGSRIKKSCWGCKAHEFGNECSLGYNQYEGKPKEICPKPLTTKKLVELESSR